MHDLIVIGAGSAGLAASKRAAQAGKKVLLIENDSIGGTCVSYGCVPKKLWHAIAIANQQLEIAKEHGWAINKTTFSWNKIQPKINAYVKNLNNRHKNKCEALGIEIIKGKAELHTQTSVLVNNQIYNAKHMLIAVGSKANQLKIPGSEYCDTSYEFFSWKKQPRSIVIWGGGYIAVELGSILNALGTRVEIIIRKPTILDGFEEDMRMFLQDQYTKRGVKFSCETAIESVEKIHNKLHVRLSNGKTIITEKVLQAVGRQPNTAQLNCEKVGVKVPKLI